MVSLRQLGVMTREDFVEAYPQTHPKWRHKYKVDASAVIRAAIRAAAQLDWRAGGNRGPREVWYNPVKPIVMRAAGMRANDYSDKFEQYLSEMVKSGELSYLDLGIVDFRTMREASEEVQRAMCWSNVVLFVEKDSAYIHLLPLKKFLNISLMSGSGWSNTSGIEAHLHEMLEQGIREIDVFTLTDYDPFGYAIDREFVDKCVMLGFQVNSHHRIGVTPEYAVYLDAVGRQIDHLESQKYPIQRGKKLTVNGISFNSDEWLAEYGIDGAYGLEIEAISGQLGGHQRLRKLVVERIMRYLDEWDRVDEVTKQRWSMVPYYAVNHFCGSHFSNFKLSELENPPDEPPTQFIEGEVYRDALDRLEQKIDDAEYFYNQEISELEDRIEELEEERSDASADLRAEKESLENDEYWSQWLKGHLLYKIYLENRDKFPRENYELGYPPGVIVESVKNEESLRIFMDKVNIGKPVEDVISFLNQHMVDGTIRDMITELGVEINDGE